VGQEAGRGFGRAGGPELGTVAIIVLLKLLTRNDLYMCGRDERFYTLEQKPVPALGRLGQLLYPDACARVAALDIALDTK
jgi:hypothetical protein